MDYLLKNTRFEEDEIKEWYRSVALWDMTFGVYETHNS